jgi:hypothetical protein
MEPVEPGMAIFLFFMTYGNNKKKVENPALSTINASFPDYKHPQNLCCKIIC